MEPVIYADTLFLFNFLMDSVVLVITLKILGICPKPVKVGIASGLGAIYSVLMFFPSFGFLYGAFLRFIVLAAVFYIAVPREGFWKTVKGFGIFLLVNFALGGIILALIFLTDFGTAVGSVVSGSGIYLNISPLILIFGIVGIYIFLGVYKGVDRRRVFKESLIKRFKIEYKGKCAELNLFLDTGCGLCDPINDKPVIIAEFSALEPILSEREKKIIRKRTSDLEVYENKMRLLPFKTVGGDNMIVGIVADKAECENISEKKVTVGIAAEHTFGSLYKGIFNPELLLADNITEVQR